MNLPSSSPAPAPESFDALVIGAGQAGPFLAARLAESGRRVALIERHLLGGDVPSPTDPPAGCRFHPRCVKAQAGVCDAVVPPLEPKEDGGFGAPLAACHFPLTDAEIAERVPTAATDASQSS